MNETSDFLHEWVIELFTTDLFNNTYSYRDERGYEHIIESMIPSTINHSWIKQILFFKNESVRSQLIRSLRLFLKYKMPAILYLNY